LLAKLLPAQIGFWNEWQLKGLQKRVIGFLLLSAGNHNFSLQSRVRPRVGGEPIDICGCRQRMEKNDQNFSKNLIQ
jgi:hypothetical protein